MKKKIALLLAAVMTVAMLPTNLFASSENRLEKAPTTVPEKTMFVEYHYRPTSYQVADGYATDGVTPKFKTVDANEIVPMGTSNANVISRKESGNADIEDVEYVVSSGILNIKLKNTLASRAQIFVDLNNAVWFFRNGSSNYMGDNGDSYYAHNEKNYYGGAFSDPFANNTIGKTNFVADFFNNANNADVPNYDPTHGVWVKSSVYSSVSNKGVGGTFYRGFDLSSGIIPDNSQNDKYVLDYSQLGNDYVGNVPYFLTVQEGNDSRASVSFPAGAKADDVICIPLVARTTSTNPVTVSITDVSNVTSITPMTLQYAAAGGGSTVTTVLNPKTDRNSFPIERLKVQETRFNTLQPGTIKLQLAQGYEFAGDTITKIRNGKIKGYIEGGFQVDTALDPNLIKGAAFGQATGSSDVDYSILYLSIGGFSKSTTLSGSFFVEGLEVIAEDESSVWGDVKMNVINGHGLSSTSYIVESNKEDTLRFGTISTAKTEIKEETVLVGKRVNWSYNFTLEKDPLTLVTGRYEDFDSANPVDDYHYVGSKVQFAEATPGTWHTQRDTTFSLLGLDASGNPTVGGVKIRKMEITDFDNIWDNQTTYGVDEKKAMKEPNVGTVTYYTMTDNGQYTSGTAEGYANFYPSDGKKHGYVTVSNGSTPDGKEYGKFTLHSFHIKDTTKLTGFKAKLWLSIEADYVGDIYLVAEGPGIRTGAWDEGWSVGENAVVKLLIAHTVQPVTIETAISEVKIGYQYQTTQNVMVTETAAGMLLRGKTVKLSLTDRIGTDMVFTPGYKVAVDEGAGYLKVKNLRTTSNGSATSQNISTTGQGTIAFDISTSSTKATKITYSNLQVKVDRDVPQSNYGLDKDQLKTIGYRVYAWGTAIAENYGTKTYNKLASSGDMFATPGVSAEYLKVITSATDKTGTLSKVVAVNIGDPKIKIGEETIDMDTAAYISPVSNSTMVPVRFISEGLGLTEQQVQWDNEARTVTIYHGDRIIQFKIGSDQLVINGVTTTIYSPDNLPVAAEIKDDRSFIPMRALGNALGVTTSWDPETQTATYNADISANAVAVDK